METVLGEQTTAPMRLCSGSNACLVLPQPFTPHRAKEGEGCLWLRGQCCLAASFRRLKPTPNMFSFGEKADWARKGLVSTGPSNTHVASLGGTHLGPISEMAPNTLLGPAFCKWKLCLGKKPQPQCLFAQASYACLVIPYPYVPLRAKEVLGCLWIQEHCCLAGGLLSMKPTPKVFSFRPKAD